MSENVALKRADIQFFPYFHSSSGFTYLFRKKLRNKCHLCSLLESLFFNEVKKSEKIEDNYAFLTVIQLII